MEPVNYTADVRGDRVELWGPTQDPGDAQDLAARVVGVPAANVTVHMERCGGGFGRRLMVDYAAEAAYLSKAVGAPVKVVRTREEDLQHDYFRPAGMHRIRAGLDGRGTPVAWAQHLANTSRYAFAGRSDAVKSELYPDDFPAQCLPNVRLEYTPVASAIPTGAWRATLHSANAFVVQGAVDELAHLAGRDPLAFRLAMLGSPRRLRYADHGGPVFDTGRLAGVLRLAADRAGWARPLLPRPRSRNRGALHVRQLRRPRRRGIGRRGRASAGAPDRGGRRLRARRESERSRGASAGRRDRWTERRALWPDHGGAAVASDSRTSTTIGCCGCATRRRSRSISFEAPNHRRVLASRRCRPLAPAVANAIFSLTGSGFGVFH